MNETTTTKRGTEIMNSIQNYQIWKLNHYIKLNPERQDELHSKPERMTIGRLVGCVVIGIVYGLIFYWAV